MPDCYYPLVHGLKGPIGYGRRVEWIEGERAAFGFFEVPSEFKDASDKSEHEQYFYICDGEVDGEVNGESKHLRAGDIMQVPRGAAYRLSVGGKAPARFVVAQGDASGLRTVWPKPSTNRYFGGITGSSR